MLNLYMNAITVLVCYGVCISEAALYFAASYHRYGGQNRH